MLTHGSYIECSIIANDHFICLLPITNCGIIHAKVQHYQCILINVLE